MNINYVKQELQMSPSAAQVYERFFVPALYYPWARKVTDAARIRPGDRVLDVACGTGVLAREAALRGANATGLDASPAMLGVASLLAPEISWLCAHAERLPFSTGEFDAAVSQFGLMYVADLSSAILEMLRVLRSGGRLAVAVCDADSSPAFWALITLVRRLFGDDAADALPAPFLVGTPSDVEALFGAAGAAEIKVELRAGSAAFSSLREWLFTEIRGWTLSDLINDDQFETLVKESEQELAQFVACDGRVIFDSPANIITAVKR